MRDLIESWGQLFAWVVGLLAILAAATAAIEAADLGAPAVLGLMAGLPLVGYAVLAIVGRSGLLGDLFVAGRAVPGDWNGLALMAQWAGGTVLFGYVGLLIGSGAEAFAYALGWSAGFFLMGVLFAPYLNKSGALTLAHFFVRRYGGAVPQALAVVLVIIGMVVLLAGALVGAGTFAEAALRPIFPEVGYPVGVIGAVAMILIVTMTGGMRSLTLAQAAQGIVILVGVLVPAIWISSVETGMPVPILGASGLGTALGGLEDAAGAARHLDAGMLQAGSGGAEAAARALSLAFATAALPAMLLRFLTTPTIRDARRSAAWGLFFALLLLLTLPALAIFAKAGILDAGMRLPQGDESVQGIGLLVGLPAREGLPLLVSGLLLAGAIAALISTAAGLLLTLGNSLAHDLFVKSAEASEVSRRAGAVRLFLVIGAGIAGYLALSPGILPMNAVFWALTVMGAGLFPALVLAVWDERSTGAGAAVAMVTGAGLAGVYLAVATIGPDLVGNTGDERLWLGVPGDAAALFGVPAGLVAGCLVSRVTPAPSAATLDFIDDMRIPRRFTSPGDF